jgi:hypothetical protein
VTIVRVKGFHIFRDRYGRWRCYHRATGARIDLKTTSLGTAAFFAECSRITALSEVTEKEKSGTLELLICEYRKSASFQL